MVDLFFLWFETTGGNKNEPNLSGSLCGQHQLNKREATTATLCRRNPPSCLTNRVIRHHRYRGILRGTVRGQADLASTAETQHAITSRR
jgi:hypothetical protein